MVGARENFLLVPGDHKRDEAVLTELSERLSMRIVRVTRSREAANAVEELSPNVELLFDVSFEDLRHLYQTCHSVLILSDSSEIPAGITSLAEALSCGADIVVTSGHSNSWPREIAWSVPYSVVPPTATAEQIATAINRLDNDARARVERANRSRAFALRELSGAAVSCQWKKILGVN
jgi:glycosyltransferase involved in cell wall biosynthesis